MKRFWTRLANVIVPADSIKILFEQAHSKLKTNRKVLSLSALVCILSASPHAAVLQIGC